VEKKDLLARAVEVQTSLAGGSYVGSIEDLQKELLELCAGKDACIVILLEWLCGSGFTGLRVEGVIPEIKYVSGSSEELRPEAIRIAREQQWAAALRGS
jgi:hypothetical protein